MAQHTGASAGPPAGTAGPTAVTARALAPDLARGAMLVLIALANAHLFLYGHDLGVRLYPAEGTLADRVVALVQMTFVDGRAYPMFAALFGYGMVQLSRRQVDAGSGWPRARRLLRRRGWWMILIGFVHALLLFPGDIIASYGLIAVVGVGVLAVSDRTLLLVAGLWMIPTALLGAMQGLPMAEGQQPFPSFSEGDPLLAALYRVGEWVGNAPGQALIVLSAFLFGVWAARRRILEDPRRHRGLLARAAVGGLAAAVAGGVPMALMASLFWTDPAIWQRMLAGSAHTVAGFAGGIGYSALIGLVASREGERRGVVVSAVAATGQRSMTFYLAQSVVFVAVFAPYAGALGGSVGVAGTAVVGAATWLVTVIAADVMRRAGHRGPAEVLLRRLTYGPRRGR